MTGGTDGRARNRAWHARRVIDDGRYDVFIVDVTPQEDGPGWRLDLTILAGTHKGDVVTIGATELPGDELDLIGLPGTLVVENGEPAFQVDR